MVTFEEFSKLEIRVGRIVEVSEHPHADKLYVLKVDVGEKIIQLVAGLKRYYLPQELEGKLIVVLVNLQPKVLRGISSSGMLLAAQSQDTVAILSPDREVPPGSIVK